MHHMNDAVFQFWCAPCYVLNNIVRQKLKTAARGLASSYPVSKVMTVADLIHGGHRIFFSLWKL